MTQFKIQKGNGLKGEITIPGDKSMSHRAIMLASLADGKSEISGFLEGEDCLATIEVFQKDKQIQLHGLCCNKINIILG